MMILRKLLFYFSEIQDEQIKSSFKWEYLPMDLLFVSKWYSGKSSDVMIMSEWHFKFIIVMTWC